MIRMEQTTYIWFKFKLDNIYIFQNIYSPVNYLHTIPSKYKYRWNMSATSGFGRSHWVLGSVCIGPKKSNLNQDHMNTKHKDLVVMLLFHKVFKDNETMVENWKLESWLLVWYIIIARWKLNRFLVPDRTQDGVILYVWNSPRIFFIKNKTSS